MQTMICSGILLLLVLLVLFGLFGLGMVWYPSDYYDPKYQFGPKFCVRTMHSGAGSDQSVHALNDAVNDKIVAKALQPSAVRPAAIGQLNTERSNPETDDTGRIQIKSTTDMITPLNSRIKRCEFQCYSGLPRYQQIAFARESRM